MPNKTQIYAQMADDTARKITGDYLDWAAFLNTSSRLYKYPFHDQLMIYAQRPDATACATYDLWNDTMRRYIRRGSKGIALLTPGPYGMDVRYVFDVSDTGTRRNSRNVEPWALSDEAMEPVRQMLEDQYYADAAMGLEGQIDQIARQQALEYWRNHARDIRDSVDGSQLAEYDDFSIGASFRKAAAASISYSIQTRCGLDPELFREDFTEVLDWNTPATVAELGKAVSDISGQILRQIETTVRMTELIYKRNGDYLLPDMGLTEAERRPLGKYGIMRQQYLEQNRPGLYTRLILSGRLMEHLQEIDTTAHSRLESLMSLLTKQAGVTEELKAQDQMAWVGAMNNLKNQAEEMILTELIYA